MEICNPYTTSAEKQRGSRYGAYALPESLVIFLLYTYFPAFKGKDPFLHSYLQLRKTLSRPKCLVRQEYPDWLSFFL